MSKLWIFEISIFILFTKYGINQSFQSHKMCVRGRFYLSSRDGKTERQRIKNVAIRFRICHLSYLFRLCLCILQKILFCSSASKDTRKLASRNAFQNCNLRRYQKTIKEGIDIQYNPLILRVLI